MAGGTGDVAFRFLDALQSQYGTAASSHGLQGGGVTISDINKDMLAVGRSRYEERYGAQYGVVAGVYQSGVERPPHSPTHTETINFVVADAMDLPMPDDSFGFATVAFGIRNVADPVVALREMGRVVRPGGRVVVLEFCKPRMPVFAQLYGFYFRQVLSRLGKWICGNRGDAYRYLHDSVQAFPERTEFLDLMREAGLESPRMRLLSGGIAAIYRAEVPQA